MLVLGRPLACALATPVLAGCGLVGSDEVEPPGPETTLNGVLDVAGPCAWLRAGDIRYALSLDDAGLRVEGRELVTSLTGSTTPDVVSRRGEVYRATGHTVDLDTLSEDCRGDAARAFEITEVQVGSLLPVTPSPGEPRGPQASGSTSSDLVDVDGVLELDGACSWLRADGIR